MQSPSLKVSRTLTLSAIAALTRPWRAAAQPPESVPPAAQA